VDESGVALPHLSSAAPRLRASRPSLGMTRARAGSARRARQIAVHVVIVLRSPCT
jgi:hypothetical protein